VLEVLIARQMMQYRSVTKSAGNRGWTQVHFLVRMVLFTAYIFLGVVASAIAVAAPKNTVRVIMQATGPLIVFIIFGTSPDLYRVRATFA
jgi:uncharacterized transporter YbjL